MANFIQQLKTLNKIRTILGKYAEKSPKKKGGKVSALNSLEQELKSMPMVEHENFARQCYKNISMRQLINLYDFKSSYYIDTLSEKELPLEFILVTFEEFYKEHIKAYNKFNSLRINLECEILNKNYANAFDILAVINSIYGGSIWACDVLMSLNTLSNREVNKKDFVNNDGTRLYHITSHIYNKHTSVSALSFKQKTKFNIIDTLRHDKYPNYADYISQLLLPIELDPERNSFRVIEFSQRLMPIDKYITIKKSILEIICEYKNKKSPIPDEILNFIYRMSDLKSDFFWEEVKQIIENNIKVEIDELSNKILALYTTGKYKEAIHSCEEYFSTNPRNLSIIEVYVRALLFCGQSEIKRVESSIQGDIRGVLIVNLIRVYQNPEHLLAAIDTIEDMCFKYQCYDFMNSIVPSYYASYPFQNEVKLKTSLYKLIASGFEITPKNLSRLSNDKNGLHLQQRNTLLSEHFSDSRKIRSNLCEELERDTINPSRVRQLVDAVYNTTDITQPDKYHLISLALIRIKDFDKIIEMINKDGKANPSNLLLFPMNHLANIIDDDVDVIKNNVDASIFCFLYFKFYKKSFNDTTSYYVDKYLSDRMIKRPSERLELGEELSESEIFILLDVCCETILSGLDNIDNSLIMLTERLKIIGSLLEKENIKYLSNDKKTSISEEEVKIYKRLLVSKLANHHASNLVNIDFKGVFNTKNDYYSLTHETILSLYKNELSVHIDHYMNLSKDGSEADATPDEILKNSNASAYHYNILYSNIINDFIMNNEFGLVRYLSSEIRHGFLPNHIRSVFEADGLVTYKVGDDKYEPPEFWLKQLKWADTNTKEFITRVLNTFSQKVDALITDTNNSIKPSTLSESANPDNSEHLSHSAFQFEINEDKSFDLKCFMEREIDRKLDADHFTFNDFKISIEDFIWSKLEQCFSNVRIAFNESIKPYFAKECDFLHDTISKNEYITNSCNILEKINNTKYNVNEKLSYIEEWFRKPISDLHDDIDINIILQASKEYIEAIYSPQKMTLNYNFQDNNEWIVKNESILNLTRSLVTMYNNCLKHGLYRSSTQIDVNVSNHNGSKNIIVSNAISSSHSSLIIAQGIVDDVLGFPLNKDDNKLINEGGTGLYKVFKNITEGFLNAQFSVEITESNFSQIITFGD
ncbi:hypothetical protein AB6866_04375 [Rahnella inusitata]|uniref:hypothetical protein n=1 Tax=Rahnella inusitata TaxID=58169 RepID=UPI0039BE9F3D